MSDLELFEAHRPSLLALAYRMLGEVQRAEDMVQEAWIRWQRREAAVADSRSYLITVVTRLCLNELDSARSRREEARGDRLPEPLDLESNGLDRVEALDQISMAFLVVLQRLNPAERAVLLLHEVFDFEHAEIARLIDRSEAACRQLLKRARMQIASQKRSLAVSPEAHQQLLRAFLAAASSGDVGRVAALLTEDAVLIADAGPEGGSYGGVRNLPGPLIGTRRVAAFVASVAPRGADGLTIEERELNGQPAALILRDGEPYTVILLSVVENKIRAVYLHADPERLGHLG